MAIIKTATLTFRIDPRTEEALRHRGGSEHRSAANMVEVLRSGTTASGKALRFRLRWKPRTTTGAFMIKTVKQACRFNPIIRDYRMSQGSRASQTSSMTRATVASSSRATSSPRHGSAFPRGSVAPVRQVRQTVFELTQAMGGGKDAHDDRAGLALHGIRICALTFCLPIWLHASNSGQARIAAFNGRNNPDNFFIWGEIATQLGAAMIKPYWANGPKAVDQQCGRKSSAINRPDSPGRAAASTSTTPARKCSVRGTLANMVVPA